MSEDHDRSADEHTGDEQPSQSFSKSRPADTSAPSRENEIVILTCIAHRMKKRKREVQRKANVLPLLHLQRRFGKLFQNYCRGTILDLAVSLLSGTLSTYLTIICLISIAFMMLSTVVRHLHLVMTLALFPRKTACIWIRLTEKLNPYVVPGR